MQCELVYKSQQKETVGQLTPCVSAECAVLTGVRDRQGRCPMVTKFPIGYLLGHISAAPVRSRTE